MQVPRQPTRSRGASTSASALGLALFLGAPVLFFSAGCVGPNADEDRPEVQEILRGELRDSWESEAAPGEYPTAGEQEYGGPFWTTFEDSVLNDLVVEALQHNHDLIASAQRLRGAAARSQVARSARLPQLDANAQYARTKNIFVGLPIPGSTGPLSALFNQWNVGLGASWELDLWGKLSASVDAADAEVAASFADLQGARLSIAAQVTNSWFALREAAQQLELAERTTKTYEDSAQVVRDRFEAGLSGALDLRLAEANVSTSAASAVAARRSYRVASRQIETLLGRFPGAELESVEDFGPMPPAVPAGVPADVLARRPDLVAAEHRMTAAESQARAVRLDRWPALALTTSGGRTSNMFDDLLDGDFTIWSIAGSLTAPLFDGGRRRARIDEALAEMRAARAQFAALALNAFFEVENALDAERLLRERLGFLSSAVESATEATSLSDEQYKEGLVSIELVLESQRRQLVAESAYLAARRELYQARVDLHVALGGDFMVESEAGEVDVEAVGENVRRDAEGEGDASTEVDSSL
ncbi:Outer membrane protein OprM precursor [Planctomycetes bacterium Poly30]|uniref:Outer membrane protein OprM n=1 Tax=Saltatorellus ferox TaxID=2528018 RepID=A0A518ESI1_9BACT|nr:Outer membrane protein OprM precursor [Planctomycetes bacterium Poly30]